MSKKRTLKRKVRARMAETGETYTAALRAILAQKPQASSGAGADTPAAPRRRIVDVAPAPKEP